MSKNITPFFIIFCLIFRFSFSQKTRTALTPNFEGKSKKEMFDLYEKLDTEIKASPSHKLYYTLSWLKYKLLDTLGAVSDIEKALTLDPKNAGYHYMHSYQIIDLGRFDEVIKECKDILKSGKKNADIYVLLGHAQDLISKHEEARANYRIALSIDYYYDDVYMRLSISYALTKSYEEALLWANKLLEKFPESEIGLKLVTSINMMKKNFIQAIESADKMIASKKLLNEAYEMQAAAYDSLGNRKEACKCMLKSFYLTSYFDVFEYILKNCPEEQKNKTVQLLNLQYEGNKCKEKGDFNGAYKYFSQTVELAPDSASSYYNRGKAKRNLEDHKGAIEDYKIAIKKNLNYSPSYIAIGVSYTFLGEIGEAKKIYLKCMEIDPLNEMAFYNYGDILRTENNIKDAIYYFEHAAMLKPDYVKAFYWLGDSYGKMNKYTEACEAFKKAEKLGDSKSISQRIWYCR